MNLRLLIFACFCFLASSHLLAQEQYEDSKVQGPPQVNAWDDNQGNSGIESNYPGGEAQIIFSKQNGDVTNHSISNFDKHGEFSRSNSKIDFTDYSQHQDNYVRNKQGNLEWNSSSGSYVDQNGRRTMESKSCIGGLKTRFGDCVKQRKVLGEVDLKKQIDSQFNKYQMLNGNNPTSPFLLERNPAHSEADN